MRERNQLLRSIEISAQKYFAFEPSVNTHQLFYQESKNHFPEKKTEHPLICMIEVDHIHIFNYPTDVSSLGRDKYISEKYYTLEDFIKARLKYGIEKSATKDINEYLDSMPLPKKPWWQSYITEEFPIYTKPNNPWWSYLPLGHIVLTIITLIKQPGYKEVCKLPLKIQRLEKSLKLSKEKEKSFFAPYNKKLDDFFNSEDFIKAKIALNL